MYITHVTYSYKRVNYFFRKMAEKKTTKAAATKATAEKKAAAPKAAAKKTTTEKKAAAPKAAAKKAVATVSMSVENVGFRAGDVYQALASAEKALSIKEIAKAANISETEVLLGAGWLLKEGKILGDNETLVLA